MSTKPTCVIRTAARADAQAIHDIHTTSVTTLCVSHYSPAIIRQWIARRTPQGYYPALDRGEMFVGELFTFTTEVGCSGKIELVGWGHAVPGEVAGLFVHPRFAGQGIGARLLAYALQLARADHTGPVKLVATLNAEAFYARYGFVPTRRFTVMQNHVPIPVVAMELPSGTAWRPSLFRISPA